jgi:hypothetical protein
MVQRGERKLASETEACATLPSAVQRFERKAWNRLIEYLISLPPLRSDY